jgi:hypothetical protein
VTSKERKRLFRAISVRTTRRFWNRPGNTPFDSVERIPYPNPEAFNVILEERERSRPDLPKAKPEMFIDDSIVRELEKEGFFNKIYAR